MFRNGFISCFQWFNVNLYFVASFPSFIFLSAASTSHAIIGSTSSGSVCIVTAWSLSYNNSEYPPTFILFVPLSIVLGSLCHVCLGVLSYGFV